MGGGIERGASMKFWKVTVLCEGYESVTDDPAKIQRTYVRMLLEAEDGVAAFEQGKELAQSARLPLDVRWKYFEPTEAATVGMPLFIDDL